MCEILHLLTRKVNIMPFDFERNFLDMMKTWAKDARILRAFTDNRYLVIDLQESDAEAIGALMNLIHKYEDSLEYSAQGVV